MSTQDEQHQRHIWQTRCPALLARAEAAEARLTTLKAALEAWLATKPESVKYPGMEDEEPLNNLLDVLDAL